MNNKIKISDFFVQLQQIDFGHMLYLLSPTIIYFIARKPIESNYRLKKDFRIGNVKTASLPTEIIRNFDDINEEEILKKQFGELIMKFVKIVKENIPEINLAIFINNLNTLQTSTKNFKIINSIFNRSTEGQYIPENNAIELSENNYNITINHELFHASTTINDKDTGMIYCGFQQISNKKKQIGESLNEGYTQYLTEKYFGKENSLNTAYTYEKRIAETLEIIVGKEKMQSLYFNANLNGLVEYLKKYAPEDDIYKFISTLDFLNEHMGDKYLIPSSKKMIKSGYKFINSFLIKTALRKNIIDNPASQLSTEEVFKCLIPILTLIPNSVKSKNDSFQISDDNLIHDAFTSVLSEYEMSDDRRTISK